MRVKSFELHNLKFTVEYIPEVWEEGVKTYGKNEPEALKIYVTTHSPFDGLPLPEDFIHYCFNHELMHVLTYFVDIKLYENETKIDHLGALQAQYEKSRVCEQ